MSERANKFANELDQLVATGELLSLSMEYECDSDQFKKSYIRGFNGNEDELKSFIKKLPNFKKEYQTWYSKSQAVIKQVLPDRLIDFVSYFEPPKNRKEITFQNYMIRDYLQGLIVTRGFGSEVIVDCSSAMPEFRQQVNMLKAAKEVLDSTLMDLKSILQADLFDAEIDTAAVLAKAGYLRAAGAICGVVIEKHLLHICDFHNLTVRKKNPSISDLSQWLRDANVTTVPQWRFIQHLADIRNICDHAKGREPTKEEIADLVEGTQKVLKTIF